MIGEYINKYKISFDRGKLCLLLIYSVFAIIMSIIILTILSTQFSIIAGKEKYFTKMNSIFVVIISISLILIFKDISIK